MKKLLIAGSALATIVLGSAPVHAADYAPPPAAAPFDWSGFYVGGYVGYLGANSTIAGVGNSFSGVDFGGIIGGNYQIDQFVVGLEGDLGWTNAKGDFAAPIVHSQEIGLNYGARIRAGYAIDNTLLFLQGGIAFADFKAKNAAGAPLVEDTLVGYQIGGGVEHAFTENVSLRVDGLYTNYGNSDNIPATALNFDVDDWRLRVGVSYMF